MTGLGAALYCGFFALAALWLFATREPGDDELFTGDDQTQDPERSNSASAPSTHAGSR